MPMKNYYQMSVSDDGRVGSIDIYGDISSGGWFGQRDRDTDAYRFSKDLEAMGPVERISVNINSNGGSVWEGIAIYNMLRRHSAKVTTYCVGAACSIASVIFMAGDERVMYPTSLLMIHNAWTSALGVNAGDLRKLADDMDTITSQSVAAYLAAVSIDEDELRAMMDAETFIAPADALAMGFATRIDDGEKHRGAEQSAAGAIFDAVIARQAARPGQSDQASSPAIGEGSGAGPKPIEVQEGAKRAHIDWPAIAQALEQAAR